MKLSFRRVFPAACAFSVLVIIAGGLAAIAQQATPQQGANAAKANPAAAKAPDHKLIFLGDRRTHRGQIRADAFIPVMKDRGIAIEYTEDVDILASPKLNEYDGLIVYADIPRVTPEQEAGLLNFVEGGKGYIGIHSASNCFTNSDKLIALLGGRFQRHGTQVMTTRIAASDNPIMKGFGGFESWDETYIHRNHNEKDRTVLEFRDVGGQAEGNTSEPWTWVRTQGKGRVFYTAWGHDLRTWNNPGFQNLVERGIRWACGGDPGLVPAFAKLQATDSMPAAAVPAPAGSAQAAAPARAIAARPGFVPPKMIDGPGRAEDVVYDDVGPAVPIYSPRARGGNQGEGRRNGGGLEHYNMPRAMRPEQSKYYYTVPEGFSLELVASEPDLGPKPISINWDAKGRLWVCETVDYPNKWHEDGIGNDRIRVCEDTNGDGVMDKFTVFADNLSIPYTLTFYHGGVICQNGGYTIYLKDTDGDGIADFRKLLITGWVMRDTHGAVSNFQYGLDNWIYAMQGYNASTPHFVDSKGVAHDVPTFRQGFWRFRLDGNDPPSVEEVEFMRSTNNNTWGLGITEEGLMFGSTANGNPSVFMPVPNRYYERVRGWSAETLRMISDTAQFAPVTDKVRQVDNFGAYTAGAGKAVYTARTYPQQWWNRTAFVSGPTGHLIGTFVLEPDGAGFKSHSPMNLVASRDEWSAPIQAEVGPDGNVWFLDWYNYIVQHNPTPPGFQTGAGAAYESTLRDKQHGRVYRLKYVGSEGGPTAPPPGDLTKASPQELIAALRHPTKLWRLQAQRLLVERGNTDVVPMLIENLKDTSVDAIGLNVGVIHALGVLEGLLGFNQPEAAADQPQQDRKAKDMSAAVNAVRGLLTHPSPGVRRNAIAALPKNDASRDAIFAAGVLNDSDAQVKLAAILALSDLPPSQRGAETIAHMLASDAAADRWLSDALYSAAAMHGVPFMQVVAKIYPRGLAADRPLPPGIERAVNILGEHLARGTLDGDQLGALLDAIAATDNRLATPVVAAVSSFWPENRKVQLPSTADAAIKQLLDDTPFESRSDLLRLARLWNAGNTDELQKAHSDALKAMISNADLSDEQRLAAANSWVRFDPDSGIVASEIVASITPQTEVPLLTGLLQAAAKGKSTTFGTELVSLYGSVLPQQQAVVLRQLLEQPETTAALLDAIAENKIDAAVLSLEQIAALKNHAQERLRTRAAELIAAHGANPNPDRQKVLADLLAVTEAKGNADHGKVLFTKNCAVCHMHSGVGETIAPDLTGMFVHPKKEILQNIIDPSRDVEANFRSYSVIANGRTYVGLFAGETRTNVTMVDSTGKHSVIQRDEIEETFSSNKSLMPDGFEKILAKSDLSDVLEFLATPQRYVPLRLASVATISSAPQAFDGFGGQQGRGRGNRGRGQGQGRGQGGAQGGFGAGQFGQRGQFGQPPQPGAPGQGSAPAAGQGLGRGGPQFGGGPGQGARRGQQLAGGQGGGNRRNRGGGGRGGRGFGLIALDQWKPRTVNDVPFTLIDPQDGAVKNVVLFGSDASFFSRGLPTTVRVPVGMPVKTLHLLSGVSIGGYPDLEEPSTSLIVRLHYKDGSSEDHELKNGVQFATVDRREDVPQSVFAFAMGDQQMRHVKINPKKNDAIVDLELVKGNDTTVPMVLAITAEMPKAAATAE